MTESTSKRTRIVLCMGAHCNAGGQAQPLYDYLRARFGDLVPAFMARGPVHWETANCLSMCGGGPNCVIYPDEAWSHRTNLATLKPFIDAHVPDADDAPHAPDSKHGADR